MSFRRPPGAPFPRGLRPPVAACLLAGLLLPASGAFAQDNQAPGKPSAELEALEKARAEKEAEAEARAEEAQKLRDEVMGLKSEMISLARQTQDLEEQLTGIEDTLAALRDEHDRREAAFREKHGQLSLTLGALQRLAAQPPEAMIARPASPIDAVRSALLLSVAVPAIEERAEALKREVEELIALKNQITHERENLIAAADALDAKREEVAVLVDRKQALEREALDRSRQARERAEQMGEEAQDLRDLMARLEEEARERAAREKAEREAREKAAREARELAEALARQEEARKAAEAARARAEAEEQAAAEEAERQAEAEAEAARQRAEETQLAARTDSTGAATARSLDLAQPENVRAFPEDASAQPLLMPARGKIIARYGERADGNEPGASKGITIETREASQVVAPFDGRVAYAGPFRGYGQILIIEHGGRYHTLLAGLGRIDAIVGQWVLAGEPVGIMDTTPSSQPTLYLELRRTGQPINPLPWLAASGTKVRG